MPAYLENSAVATGLEKSAFIPILKKGNGKECSNYHTVALISHASKVMLKILQARLQQYMNWEFLDIQAAFRKGSWTRDKIVDSVDHRESKGVPEKHLLLLIEYAKAFDYVDHNKLENS